MHDRCDLEDGPAAVAGRARRRRRRSTGRRILRFDSRRLRRRLQADLDDADGARRRGVRAAVRDLEGADGRAAGRRPATELPTLYQPIHGRFYLVTGGLVCERYGLPDKVVHPKRRVGVLRAAPAGAGRRRAPSTRQAGARSTSSAGCRRDRRGAGWRSTSGLVDGEERLPLFPMTYVDGRRRRVLAGMVPVARPREVRGRPRRRTPIPQLVDDRDAVPGRCPGMDATRGRGRSASRRCSKRLDAATGRPCRRQPEAFDGATARRSFFALVDLAAFLADRAPGSVGTALRPDAAGRRSPSCLRSTASGQSTWNGALTWPYAAPAPTPTNPSDQPAAAGTGARSSDARGDPTVGVRTSACKLPVDRRS